MEIISHSRRCSPYLRYTHRCLGNCQWKVHDRTSTRSRTNPHRCTFTHTRPEGHSHTISSRALFTLFLSPPRNERTKVPGFSFHVSNKDTTASLCSSSQLASITVRTWEVRICMESEGHCGKTPTTEDDLPGWHYLTNKMHLNFPPFAAQSVNPQDTPETLEHLSNYTSNYTEIQANGF